VNVCEMYPDSWRRVAGLEGRAALIAFRALFTDEDDTTRHDTTRKDMSMNARSLYPGKWLAAADLDGADMTLTIKSLEEEEISRGDPKWVLGFREVKKRLVLNKTNTDSIAVVLGDETDGWIGKRITLFSTEVDYKGDQVEAIRVRTKPPATRSKKPAKPYTQAEADMDDDDDSEQIPF
jgi:hypothetical protein